MDLLQIVLSWVRNGKSKFQLQCIILISFYGRTSFYANIFRWIVIKIMNGLRRIPVFEFTSISIKNGVTYIYDCYTFHIWLFRYFTFTQSGLKGDNYKKASKFWSWIKSWRNPNAFISLFSCFIWYLLSVFIRLGKNGWSKKYHFALSPM